MMDYHVYVLYLCIIILTGYILYIRKYLNKVVVVLDTQKKFYVNTSTQTFTIGSARSSSTETLSDYQEACVDLQRNFHRKSYHSDTLEDRDIHPKRIHRGRKRWQKSHH